jgi:hypothetical protein
MGEIIYGLLFLSRKQLKVNRIYQIIAFGNLRPVQLPAQTNGTINQIRLKERKKVASKKD